MPSGQACIYARSSGPSSVKWAEAKGDLDLRFKVVLWKPLHNATINTRVVEGGPKNLKRACYRALFDVVNRIRPIDLHACDPRIQISRRVKCCHVSLIV